MIDFKGGLVISATLLVGLAIGFAIYKDQQSWNKFVQQHHCVVVKEKPEQTGTSYTMDGKVGIVVIPAETTYSCDDGKEYVR